MCGEVYVSASFDARQTSRRGWRPPRDCGCRCGEVLSGSACCAQAIPAALAGRAFPPIKTKRGQEDGGAIRVLDNGGRLDDYLANLGGLKLPKLSVKAKRLPERSESIQVATLWRPKPSRVAPGLERSSSMLASQGP